MGKAWVFQSRGPVFDSGRVIVVSGRASDLKCSCVPSGSSPYTSTDTETKKTKQHHGFSHGITGYRGHEFFLTLKRCKIKAAWNCNKIQKYGQSLKFSTVCHLKFAHMSYKMSLPQALLYLLWASVKKSLTKCLSS